MIVNYTDGFLQSAQKELSRRGMEIATADLKAALEQEGNEEFFERELSEVEYDGTYGLDTVVREEVLDAIARFYVGMDWPLNCDSQEYKDRFDHRLRWVFVEE